MIGVIKRYIGTIVFLFAANLAVAAECTLPFTLPENQWQLISLPCEPPIGTGTVDQVIGDDMGDSAVYGDSWVMYAYDAGSNSYRDVGAVGELSTGLAYWIFNQTGASRSLSMPEGSQVATRTTSAECPADTSSCLEVELDYAPERSGEEQFNMIGIPTTTPIAWSDIHVANNLDCSTAINGGSTCTQEQAYEKNIFQNFAWRFDGSEYSVIDESSTLSPWDAVWVKILSSAEPDSNLRLQIPSDPSQCPIVSTNENIIFETDFSNDTGYSIQSVNLWNGGVNQDVPLPTGWDGVKATFDGRISVVPGAGVDGGNAMRFEWDPNATQPTLSLGKHLTDDQSTGYRELYIRYHIRLPNRFVAGTDGTDMEFWKWGRLWQNTAPYESIPNNWKENREDSGFVVWTFSGGHPYSKSGVVWAASEGPGLESGSVGGPRYKLDYFDSATWDPETSLGAFESLWDINNSSRPGELENNSNQRYHTVEFRFKLASTPDAEDGVFEFWFDGNAQGPPARILAQGGARERSGIPTPVINGGFNFLTLFDNLRDWNNRWGEPDVDGYIDLNDIVISESYIGPDYRVCSVSN